MFDEKKYTGYGTCKLGNGEYTGDLVNGVRQGYGVMIFVDRNVYDGDWDGGKMHGIGQYKFWNNEKGQYTHCYKGQFNHGVREGKGRMEYSNHDVYQGTWQNDYRTGDGICWFADGSVFHGLWKFDEMVRGVFRRNNGELYDGEMKGGKYNGYGKLFWPNGKWFEGIFVDNNPFNGMVFSLDGNITELREGRQSDRRKNFPY